MRKLALLLVVLSGCVDTPYWVEESLDECTQQLRTCETKLAYCEAKHGIE